MAEIEIDVAREELHQFEIDERLSFPAFGMTCKVQSCPCFEHFYKFGSYVDHYNKFHSPSKTVYRCSLCKRVFGNKQNAKRHLKDHTKRVATLTKESRSNPQFRDPEGIKIPRPPTEEDRHYMSSSSEAVVRNFRRMEQFFKRQTYKAYMERKAEETERVRRQMWEFDKEYEKL